MDDQSGAYSICWSGPVTTALSHDACAQGPELGAGALIKAQDQVMEALPLAQHPRRM